MAKMHKRDDAPPPTADLAGDADSSAVGDQVPRTSSNSDQQQQSEPSQTSRQSTSQSQPQPQDNDFSQYREPLLDD